MSHAESSKGPPTNLLKANINPGSIIGLLPWYTPLLEDVDYSPLDTFCPDFKGSLDRPSFQALAVQLNAQLSLSTQEKDFTDFFKQLISLRVLDIYTSIADPTLLPSIHVPRTLMGSWKPTNIMGFAKLAPPNGVGWLSTIQNAKDILEQDYAQLSSTLTTTHTLSDGTSPDSVPPAGLSAVPDSVSSTPSISNLTQSMLRLFHDYEVSPNAKDTVNIISSIQMAALYLAWLLSVLIAALFVSPLILLSGVDFTSRHIKRVDIIKLWYFLGNQKPQRLQKVEESLWRIILQIALSRVTAADGLKQFFEENASLIKVENAQPAFSAEEVSFFSKGSGQALPTRDTSIPLFASIEEQVASNSALNIPLLNTASSGLPEESVLEKERYEQEVTLKLHGSATSALPPLPPSKPPQVQSMEPQASSEGQETQILSQSGSQMPEVQALGVSTPNLSSPDQEAPEDDDLIDQVMSTGMRFTSNLLTENNLLTNFKGSSTTKNNSMGSNNNTPRDSGSKIVSKEMDPKETIQEDIPQMSTFDTIHRSHVDANGFATWVTIETGCKLWIIAVPGDGHTYHDFAEIDVFGKDYDLDMSNGQGWTLIKILLTPGDTITIQDTSYSLFHNLVQDDILTNTSHPGHRLLLSNILLYWANMIMDESADYLSAPHQPHLPDLTSYSGIVDLLSLINIVKMGSLLWPEQYGDNDPMDPTHMKAYHYAKSQADNLCSWFDTYCQILNLHTRFLVKQAVTLYRYASRLEESCDSERIQTVTAEKVKTFFEEDFIKQSELVTEFHSYLVDQKSCPSHFAFAELDSVHYSIGRKKNQSHTHQERFDESDLDQEPINEDENDSSGSEYEVMKRDETRKRLIHRTHVNSERRKRGVKNEL
ncbi:hypothetical protein K435DRAFT_789933 [Dendrothele bispora CBS 962.96]|uniref:JmjC domain-containing protein n=1 Tax=Dendrothele bispora (strain CBS 962.96) TaxID=1314807 RepID=A0A4S8MU50_DENBC|nr:hypothetical protein K435DRAFT_789933 [Dendrothele bispora CBS 962.96]